MSKKPKQHSLTQVPTAFDEIHKVIESADTENLEKHIPALESNWKEETDSKLPVLTIKNKAERRTPLVDTVSMQGNTFSELLERILSLQNAETFEAIMLLFEYMEEKKNFKIPKLTGTELLKLSGYEDTPRQEHRDRILRKILEYKDMSVTILDPERTAKNQRNANTEEGEVYQNFQFLQIKRTIYSKRNPDLIVSLEGIEFMPNYINFLPVISRRYLPLEQLRKIPKHVSTDKSRFFITRICFKFAGISDRGFALNLEECMNIGKFFNKSERDKKRLWQPIEKAFLIAEDLELLRFRWVFRKPTKNEIEKDKLIVNEYQEITTVLRESNGTLKSQFYKYIQRVELYRTYDLNVQIELPLELEKISAEKEREKTRVEFFL